MILPETATDALCDGCKARSATCSRGAASLCSRCDSVLACRFIGSARPRRCSCGAEALLTNFAALPAVHVCVPCAMVAARKLKAVAVFAGALLAVALARRPA